jgi:Tat protein secretion system quality control protein TatD with DNase activity
LFVKEVVKEIAKIKNLSYQEVSEITTQNAKRLFNL